MEKIRGRKQSQIIGLARATVIMKQVEAQPQVRFTDCSTSAAAVCRLLAKVA